MSWDDIKVKISSYFEGKGYASWIKSSNEAATSAAKATSKATALAGVMGSMDGSLGKAASGVASVAHGFAMLGPAGAAIAGLKALIDMVGNHFIKKAEEMKDAVERMGEKIRSNFDKMKSKTLEEINAQLAKATTEAAAAANRFDALASAYMKVAQAKDAVAKSGGSAAVSGLALEKAQKMSEMSDKSRAAVDKVNAKSYQDIRDEEIRKAKEEIRNNGYEGEMARSVMSKANVTADEKIRNRRSRDIEEVTTNEKNEKAVVGAGYDVRIAEEELANTRSEQDRNVRNVRKEAEDAAERKFMASDDEWEAKKALDKATSKYNRFKDASVEDYDKGTLKELEAKKKEAENALTAATNKRIKADADAEASALKITEAENKRVTAINNSLVALQNARDTENELKAAQKEAARAQIERANAELAAAKAAKQKEEADRKAAENQENAGILSSAKGEFSSKFEKAFDLWRDPEAASAAVDADKKRSADLKEFDKAVNRYGGKGKIDEYAALMRAGDEEGMQSRLEQWRKSSKFTPQVEQMVKAEAARQNENDADRALANIEKNTANLDKKLDQLLSLK